MILTIHDSTGTNGGGGDRRRYLQIGLLALALLLVAVLGFRQVQRLISPEREVWVAAGDLEAGATVGPSNLRKAKVAESSLPKGALLDARAIASRELARPKQEGEPFVREDFANASQAAVAAAEMIPEGRVLTTVRVRKALVPYKNLKNGDRVDLIGVEDGFARVVANDAYLVGMIFTQPPPQPARGNGLAQLVASTSTQPKGDPTLGLVLGLHPEDALPLAQMIGSNQTIQVVLHGSAEVATGQLLELPAREITGVELIAGQKTSRLKVTP